MDARDAEKGVTGARPGPGRGPGRGPGNEAPDTAEPADFIRTIIAADVREGKNGGRVHTRFPPEPNGYLHIGHAKAFSLDFGVAAEFGGLCNLRFDDTNPVKEDVEYVESIQDDIRWLGFDWGDRLFHASDYYEQLYEWAQKLIRDGKAYVCDLGPEEVRTYRGTLTEPGTDSPFRNRSVEENLDLFARMRAGEFPEGARTLRAKIDMASPNMNMRDPIMYRIIKASHHRTGDAWCIYPSYDWAHGQSDALEGITHSLCSQEYEIHRPLYDWFLDQLALPQRPRQIEFARLNLTHTVMSKRLLLQLVQDGLVAGWDDPRMPTLCGMRRRGYTPEAVRAFLEKIGMAKRDSTVDLALLEHCVREDLNKSAPRVMGVLRPLRLVLDNYPEGQVDEVDLVNNPEDPSAGTRKVPFSKVLYIEQDDFREEPPKGYYRLYPGNEVRLRGAFLVRCTSVVKDVSGAVAEIHGTYDPASRGGNAPDGRKVKSTIHWVSAAHALDVQVRLYDTLFSVADPGDDATTGGDWKKALNPDSLEILTDCKLEPSLGDVKPGWRCQFERLGYFCVEPGSAPGKLVFNRTVTLKDTWARMEKRAG
jgi:glutaminyl-tRNA synthetase